MSSSPGVTSFGNIFVELSISLAGVVRVDDAEQTERVGAPQRGGVEGGGGLVLAARALEPRGARA